ncbi:MULTISPECIES: ABC transporter ATP-binding protein [Thalassospira]|jgi:branched-chain amino acid transport system ATP-binding protein|uniref:ABC transporter ATP-binding protein n=1 Tax=Thalassospira TaxID=168934 RepID=UPI0003B74D48|nr:MULTISPECIES: ABC transporter ATP-binding protein [Thalassospira]MBV17131.1 ABC transporter ATP-binding protein [Thalassospira sp.]RCK30007.1 ABC transporter ATP-binding protein [Thalassospira lucentensis MCCC 1A00383 = DSM 14000]|tara:strand:- start:26365 stop:27141 length:777 start_codon:yes stop_codon:yes gene_type:complete
MTTILETRSLNKEFGAVIAAKDLNVQVAKGEVVGVIGSNGAGKTTFINMVTGYLKPTRGEILFNGKSILGHSPRAITRAGMARSFQVAQLFPDMSVIDNLIVALAAAESPRPSFLSPLRSDARIARAEEILAEFGIENYQNSKVTAVPQGARKLVDIAMALIGNPQMLLLDEPTSGVSMDEKTGLMDTVMNAVRQHGVTVLFVEHDMDVVERYVSRVLAFYSGEIIADGKPAAVLADNRVRDLVTGHRPTHKKGNGAS